MAKKKESKARLSARKRAEEHESSGGLSSLTLPDGMNLFSLKSDGVKKINVYPFKAGKGNPYADEGMLHFERTYFTHRGIGPNNTTYVCPAKTLNKPCPICEHRAKLANDPDADEDQQELIKGLAPKERQLWCIENVTAKDDEAGKLQIWDISHFLFGKMLDDRIKNSDEEDGYEYFADPDEGMTLKIGVEEKSFKGNSFYNVSTIDFKKHGGLNAELLEEAPCLDECLKILSYKELQKAFLAIGETDDDDDDEDEDEKPKSKKEKAKSKAREEEDEEDDDEEDEEPKSSKKSRDGDAPTIKVGMPVEHEEWGVCVVVKIVDGVMTLEDEEGETHKKVPVKDVKVLVKKKKAKPVEEDDDEEDEEPAPKKKSKSKKVEEDDDDEDDEDEDEEDEDDDDDEEEEERPAKKAKSSSTKKKKKSTDDDDEDIPF